jgi:DNA polymerase/3'-5' exonuclease PolX
MSTDNKYPYAGAHKVASYILDLLRPWCERIHLAGSLRRMRPEVKDIEIVCEPKREFVQDGLFADNGDMLIVKDFTEALATITEAVIKGNIDGRYMQIKTTSKICPGIYLDLFMPQPADYWRQYAIRTGSAEYAQVVIASGWKKKGWVGVKDLGLRKISECDYKEDSQKKKHYFLKPDIISPELPPEWKSEGEFFTWLGVEYKDPELREFHNPVNTAL